MCNSNNETQTDEWLSCPFCGGQPEYWPEEAIFREKVHCGRCRFQLPPDVWQMRNEKAS